RIELVTKAWEKMHKLMKIGGILAGLGQTLGNLLIADKAFVVKPLLHLLPIGAKSNGEVQPATFKPLEQ
ncbi:hypothetical protein, partial [Pseudosulfitobacter pseudonitzschiae]|uniref:hypothetical protein n=1 Tax=Pseudosulfitobacter pseudonitzschiae TaxID=1402135 RepID=UPI001B80CB48